MKNTLLLGCLALVLTFSTSCENEDDENGTTTSSSTTSGTTTSSTSTTSSTTSSSTSGSTTSSTTSASCIPTSSEVVIGSQIWTTTNLNVDKFRNGDLIPEAKTGEEWVAAGNAGTPAWCYYLNSPDSGAKYGKLYNWYAVNDSRGLAPTGWHVPSDAEWTVLTDYLGGASIAGTKMKNTCGWHYGVNGTNTSGFTGLPSGYRNSSGTFSGFGYIGYWWNSSVYDTIYAWYRYLDFENAKLGRFSMEYAYGLSVRLVKD